MKIKSTLWIGLFISVFLVSCGKKPSLQSYYVNKMDDSSFLIVNLPLRLDSLFNKDLSLSEQSAVSSVDKLNLLLYSEVNVRGLLHTYNFFVALLDVSSE